MNTLINFLPKTGGKNDVSHNTFFSTLLDNFSVAGLIPILLIAGVAGGVWLGMLPDQETEVVTTTVDQAWVEGVRAALPTAPNNRNSPSTPNSLIASTSYLVAVANGDGVRLRTIVTR